MSGTGRFCRFVVGASTDSKTVPARLVLQSGRRARYCPDFFPDFALFWACKALPMEQTLLLRISGEIRRKTMQNNNLAESFSNGCAVSSVGRALPRHGRGHKFKSCTAHHPTPSASTARPLRVAHWFRRCLRTEACSGACLSSVRCQSTKSHQPLGGTNKPSEFTGSRVKSSCLSTNGHRSSAVFGRRWLRGIRAPSAPAARCNPGYCCRRARDRCMAMRYVGHCRSVSAWGCAISLTPSEKVMVIGKEW
jgi:hypothetical protein